MTRCLLKLYDRILDINQAMDACAYLAIRENGLLDADADTLYDCQDDIKESGLKISALYGKTTQYYANFCKTEDFFYNNFRNILIEFFKIHNIEYDIIDLDIHTLKKAQGYRIMTENLCIKNIFSELHPPEYYLQCLFSKDIPARIENYINFLSNCKMSSLYIRNIDTKKYKDFKKIYAEDSIFSEVMKKEKISLVYRLLPAYTPKDLFSLLHNLQLYF